MRGALWPLVGTLLFAGAASAREPAREVAELGRLEREAVDSVLRREGLELDEHPDGKTVGAVRVVNLEVFSEREPYLTWLNHFHVTTRADVMAREVLLAPGERWSQERADETRRNLRDPILSNVVVVLPVKATRPGEVDLLLVTRDVWSLRLNSGFEVQGDVVTLATFSLTENNLFGRRKRLAAVFFMDQGAISVGPTYEDGNMGGSRLVLSSMFRALFARDTRAFEGTRSLTSFGYPLRSLASRWGASLDVSHFDAPIRKFLGTALRTYDVPETDATETLPWSYQLRTLSTEASVVRSFGSAVKQLVYVGHDLDLTRPSPLADFVGDDALRAAFTRDVLPRSELSSAAFLRYRLYTPVYAAFRDLDTFDLREDLRLGPTFEAKLSAATALLGSERDFLRFSAAAQWAVSLTERSYQRVMAGWSGRLDQGRMIDNAVTAEAYVATAQLGRLLRIVAEATLDGLVRDTSNRFLALGGDNGLRGYPIAFFSGAWRALGHLELRSTPLRIAFIRLGALAFWDGGDAAQAASDLTLHQDVGVGVRVLIPQLDPMVMRGDWAVAFDGPTAGLPGRLSLGLYQVF